MSRSSTFTGTNGTKSTARFTTTATIKCEAYPADDGSPPPSPPRSPPPSPPPSPTPSSAVSVGKRWHDNMNNISSDNISNGKRWQDNMNNMSSDNISNGNSLSNGHGPKAILTTPNGGASYGSAVKKTGCVEDRWKPNSTSTSRDYTSPPRQGAQNGLLEPVRPSRISLAAMGSKNDNYVGPKNGAIGLGGPAPPPPPAPPMPSFGATNGSSAGFSGRSVSRTDLSNKVSKPVAAPTFGTNTNSLPRGFNSKTFNHNSVPRGYTPSAVNGTASCKGFLSTSSTSTLPAGSSSTLPRGFNSSVATNGGTKYSCGSATPSSGLVNTLRRADSADPNPSAGKPKADPNDPQVRKLVYNMYRGLLDKKHDHSNTIISSLPQLQVDRDEGVKNRVLSMMKQQEELKSGKISTMNGPAGPPPPPPPPPFIVAGATPPVMPEPIQVARPAPRSAPVMPLIAPPAALAGAMMKDKKPFTYTPGGLDLSEIRSPRMQRRLSRNAALEGVRPSPLAQHSSTCSPTPGSQSPSVQSGLAVQVLPMPGMTMARTTPVTPPPSQPKEPVVKKNVCGPPPPPPPFTVSSGDFKLSPPDMKSVPSGSKATASPPMPSYVPSELVLTTPSSPPFSSPPSDPRSPSLSLASTNSNDSGTNIPAPPPPPPQSGAARRASIVKNGFNGESTPPTPIAVAPPSLNQAYVPQSQALSKGADASESKMNNTGTAAPSNISPNSFGESDTSRSRESSSMAVEDSSTSFREESATPSVVSNIDRPEEDMEHYNSNESLLKQISALEQITAKHQSKPELSSGLRVSNGNDRISSKTPERQSSEPKVQPILRLSSASKQPSSQPQQEEEELRRKEFEQQEHKKELEELERQRQFEEHERQVQFEEQERQNQYEEHERQMQIEEQNRQRQLEEQERRQKQSEEQDRERRLQEERQRQQEIELQRKQELERQRQQELERKREQEQIERQREAERKKQQEEQERLRQLEESRQRQIDEEKRKQLEAQRLQELENQKLREDQEWQRHQQEEERMRLEEQDRQRQQLQQQPENQNRFMRQGSVPIQVRQASFRADTNQQENTTVSKGSQHVRSSSVSRSPNVSPTSGLIKAPLPWMSAIPRRETSAPPEFVNYAQTAQSRLQQQRAQRQQSYEQGKAPQAPSPVLKEAVVVSPPVVYQHPGQNEFGRSTLPRNTKLNSGPAQRPWVAKHQQYQPQQQTSEQQSTPRPLYQQPQQQQQAGPGQRWPEVKQPNYLRQQSSSKESSQRTFSSGGPKVRIIPITVEQDSSSDQEQPYMPSSVNNPTIRSVPINSCYGSYQPTAPGSNNSNPVSPRTPQTPLSTSTQSSQRWSQQPSFTAPQQQQPQQQRLPMQQQQPPPPPPQQQPQKVNYNNPIGLYSDSNAVEALQQMQQSLAQLNTGLQNPGPGVAIAPDVNSAPMQSRSFRILQNVVDSEASEPQGPVHIGMVKTQQQQPRLQHGGSNGGAIPSRAFRALQQHTYGGQQEDAEVPPRSSASPPHPMSTSPSPSFPSSSSSQSHASSSERIGDRYSQPLSGTTFRSVAPHIVVNEGLTKHRNVVNSALTKQREASPSRHWHVNTTSSSRSASPANQNNISDDQSRLLKFISQEAADSANRGDIGVAQPKKLYDGAKIPSRVFKQLQTEFSDSPDVPDSKRPTPYDALPSIDGGDKPQLSAGLLRLLQSDFDKLQNDRSPSNIENCVLSSSYGNENNQTYKNGIVNTAATKEHVLKELTTQFDPVTQCRKPRAAPGRVFRYLQQQYDEPEDTDERPVYSNNNNNANKKASGRSNSLVTSTIGQKSAYLNGSGRSSPRHNSIPNEMTSHELTGRPRFHSPSFAHLQSQYHQEDEGRDTVNGNAEASGTSRTSSRNGSSADDVDNHDLNSLRISEDGDPVLSKPYVGNRIPGRTFRMLQENYASHPSVLQARK